MWEIPPIDRDSWLFLRDLPPDTPEETNNSPGAIKRIFDNLPQQPNSRNRSRNPNTVEYVHEYAVINNVDPSIIASEPNYGSLIGNGHQTFYHERLEKLILRVPSRACEMAKQEISFLFGRYLAERGLDKELGTLGETMFVDPPYWKEASESWISAELADGEAAGGAWPSVVLEVGYCYERLRTEAAWWLRRSEGEVKAVIILEVSPRGNRPKLHIEHWRPELDAEGPLVEGSECARSPAVVPRLMQCMTVEEGDGCEGTVTSSMPLTITFAGIFRREPRNEQETDLVISTHDMEQIALRLWRSLE